MSKTSISTKALLASTSIGSFARHMAFAITGLVAVTAPAYAIDDNALPTGGNVAAGSANFDYNGNLLNVNQNSQNVVIDWSKFNIGQNAVTQFNQPNVAAIAVNRVHDVDPSYILGALKANGQVVVLNANGVVFGQNSHVDVAGLLVSTGDINTSEFMNTGKVKLSAINAKNGTIEVNGQINVATGGMAAFIAPNVVNNGIIQANLGKIELASGADKATVDMYGDGLVELALDDKASKAVITNNGTLRAHGGKINITVKAAKDIVNSVVNMNGVVEANSFNQKNGVINLDATNADVKVAGKVSAQGGNGKINVRTNKNIDVAQTAEFNASAGTQGNGGTINVIADGKTDFAGSVISRGGDISGNGGFAEISGYDALGYSGYANLGATNGEKGSLLLDPTWAIIHSGAAGGSSGYLISAQALANAMETTNVTVQADQFIDVGAKDSYGSAILNVLAGAFLGNGNIDLSTFNYNTYQVVYTNIFGVNVPTGINTIVHNGTTAGSLKLESGTVNFNKDLKLGTGDLNVAANTVNLNGKLSDISGGLVQTDITSTANTVNVQSNAAYIQQGLYLVANGGTVNVGDGTYTENVTVSKAVKLLSKNGRGATTIDGVASGSEQGTVYITAGTNNVQVGDVGKGFTIKGLNGNGASEKAAIYIQGNNSGSKIIGNDVVAQGDEGLMTEYSATIDNLLIDRNIFSGKTFVGATPGGLGSSTQFDLGNNVPRQLVVIGGGVDGGNTSNVTFTNNDVTGTTGGLNSSSQEQGNHLVTISSKTSTITGNNFTGTAARYGAALRVRGDHGYVVNNTVVATAFSGIHVEGGDTMTVSANDISGTKVGVLTENAKNTLIDNNTIHNVGVGIDLEGGSANTASNNKINSTASTAILANNGTGLILNLNKIGQTGGVNSIGSDGILVKTSNGAKITNNTVSNTNGDGIKVVSSDSVAVNGNTVDHTAGAGIYGENTTNSSINNNNVSYVKHYAGILTNGGGNLSITNNTVNHSDEAGIMAIGNGLSYLIISDNTIDNTGENIHSYAANSGDGILVRDTNSFVATGNKIGLNGQINGNGLSFASAGKGYIAVNKINNTTANGLYLANNNNSEVQQNIITNTGLNGILVTDGANNTIGGSNGKKNKISNVANGDGILVTASNGTKITHNDVSSIAGSGIKTVNTSNAEIKNNRVTNISWDGIGVIGGTGVSVDANTIDETTRVGLYSTGTTNLAVTNNTVTNMHLGGYGAITVESGTNHTITGNNVSGSDQGIRIWNVAGVNTISNNNLDGLLGDGIHSEGTADLTANNNKIGLNALVKGNGISANGVTSGAFNGNTIKNTNGHGLNMVNVNNDGGDFINMNNNIITGAKGDGIHIEGGLRLGADSNTISNTTGNAIYVKNSGNTYLTQNPINTTGKDGIYVEGVNSGFVGFNDITLTTGNGINAVNTNDTTFLTNTITKTSKAGVKVAGGLRNTFKDNTLKNIGNQGFVINGLTDGLKLDSNHLDTISWVGIQMDGGKNASFVNNDINKTNDDGFRISGTQTIDVSGNTVTNAKGSAITANGTKNATIKNNTLTTSGSNGIKATGGQLMEITNNVISGTGDNGILVNGLTNVVAKDNTIGGFVNSGIDAENVTTLTAQNNTITGTHTNDTGIYAFNTSNATIKDNTIANASYAIFLEGNGAVTKGLIDNNTITGADAQAIHTRSNAFADILNNKISNSSVGIVTENMYGSTGSVTKIQNNIISASKIGIRNNLSYGTQSGFLISDNTITAENPAEARRWTGIDVISQQGGVATTFQNNTINGAGAGNRQSAGYELTNITNTGTVIDGGTVSNVDVGVWATDGSFYTGAVNDLLIKNVAFKNNRQTGILVEDTEDALNQTGVNPTGTKVTIGSGNTFTGTTPYDLTIAGDNVTIALAAGFNGVQKTFVKAAGPAHYVGNPSGTTTNLTTNNASINTGIGATAAGGTVTVDTGTFKEAVLANKGVTLTGLASTGTIIDGTGLVGDGIRVSADNVTLKDLTVQKWTSGIDVRTAINNLKIKNVTSKSNNSGFKVANSGSILGLTVSDSHFDNNTGFGWYIAKDDNNLANTTNVKNVIVSDTTFDNNGNKGIYAEKLDNAKFTDVSASNNTVSGIDINLKNGDYTDIVFNRLTVTGAGNGVAVKARNDAPYTATPATLSSLIIKNSLIDTSGTSALSIGNAIASAEIFNNNAANSGGIKGKQAIIVYGGANADIHNNDISNASTYGVLVADSKATIWKNNITSSTGTGKGVWLYNADNSLVGDLTNDNKGNVIDGFATGVQIDGTDNTTVAHNTIKNISAGWNNSGININGGSNITINENTLKNIGGQAIYAEGPYAGPATTLNITNNDITDAQFNAIYLKKWNGAKVSGNNINGAGGHGVSLELTTGTNVEGNTIKNVANNGVDLWYGNADTTIKGNTIHADKTGVNVSNGGNNTNTTIDTNTIKGGLKGIAVENASIANIVNNTIKNTAEEGVWINNSNKVTVDTNDISNTGKDGVYASLANRLKVIGNTIKNVTGNGVTSIDSNRAKITGNDIKNVSGNGIEVDGGRNVAINDNIVNHSAAGIVANNTKGHTKINNNIINNVTGDAIYAFNNKQLTIAANEIGLKNNSVIGGNGITVKKANKLLVKGNTIDTALGNGIDMTNIKAATVQNNKVKGNSNYGLFFKSGVNGSLVLTNNKIESLMNGTAVGARFEGGQIDLTSANKNTFIGGENGLEFSGSNVSLVGNTFGTTKFKDQNGYYIALSNGGLFGAGPGPQILDARQVNFDGFTPGTFMLNFADWQALTAKLYDYNDLASLGLIFFTYPTTDINDILPRQRYGFDGRNAIGSVTITGLPYATLQAEAAANTNVNTGAFGANPNNVFNLITNAGPNSGKKVASNDAADLNNIETAAGGNETAGCWAQVYSHFGHSTSAVTYNLDSSPAAMLADQASCK